MGVCPFANQDHRYDRSFAGQVYTGGPNKGVLHTTETSNLPGYAGGGNAPHFSVLPIFAEQRVVHYQHFDTDRPSRALRDLAGGVQTNNDGVIQVELIGTCTTSGPGLYWPEAPEWALAGVRELMAWIERDRGIPHTADLEWLPYPSSYGATSVRFSQKKWDDYAGWCGHQHVPENDHGDPGDMSALFQEEDPLVGLIINLTDFQKDAIGTKDGEWEVEKILGYLAGQAALARRYSGRAATDAAVARALAEESAKKGSALSDEEIARIAAVTAKQTADELSDDFEVTGDVKLAKKPAEPTA